MLPGRVRLHRRRRRQGQKAPGTQFTTQVTCFASTQVPILTLAELLFLQGNDQYWTIVGEAQLNGRISSLALRADSEEVMAGTDTAKMYSLRCSDMSFRLVQESNTSQINGLLVCLWTSLTCTHTTHLYALHTHTHIQIHTPHHIFFTRTHMLKGTCVMCSAYSRCRLWQQARLLCVLQGGVLRIVPSC